MAGRPVRADWVLTVVQREGSTGAGFVRDWGLNVASYHCLQGGAAICGIGPGQLFARGATDGDDVHLECPTGGVISEIVWARYGRIEGSCEEAPTAPLTVHDQCEALPATVKKRVASACVGHTSCTVHALDTLYAEEAGEPFLCPHGVEQVECREDQWLGVERSSRRQARYESREHHAQAHMAPVTYAGTEDHYFKSTMVRHRTEPFFRPRRDVNSSSNNGSALVQRLNQECSSEPRVKKALMVQARCKDANAAFKHTDTPAVAKKVVMASASGDLDNDWKDEVVTLFGYEGGALHASFTAVGANGQPTTTVVRDLAVGGGGGGSAVVLGEGAHIEMAMGDFDNDGYPELAFAFVDGASGGGGGGALKVFLWDLRVQSTAVWGSSVAKTSRQDLQPCYACFTDIAKLRGLFATAVEVAVPGMPSFPIVLTGAAATAAGVESGSRLEAGGFGYSLAAAKVNALPSMLAVAWIADRSTVSWALFRQTAQSAAAAMVSASPYSLVSLRQPHAVAVNLGDYEGSGFAELALGIVDDDELTLYLYSIDELALDGTLPMALQKTLPITAAPWWDTAQYNVRMVSGDLNNDGDDELVVALTSATEGSGSQADVFRVDSATCFRLACLELVGSFAFTLPSGPTISPSAIAAVEGIVDVTTTATTTAGSVEEQMTTTRSPEIKLAIGNVDESYANELLVAFEYSPTITSASAAPKVMLTSLTAQPDPDRPFVVNGRQCYAGPAYQRGEEVAAATVNNMALSVGNLYGLGYRVGKSIKVRFESVPELIAVINAPPTHFDIVDGKEVVVNPRTFNGYGSSTRLSNAEGVASSFTISRDLVHTTATSVDASARAKVVAVVANAGVQFEEMKKRANELGQSTVEQISVSRELVASGDDVVLYMSTTRDLWKLPIVDQNGAQVGSLDIWASSSCGEDCVQKGDGRDLWWFTPDHEPFNVLTYSSRAPEDFNPANRIMVGEKVTLGPNEHQQAVTQSSSKAETKMGGQHNSTAADKSLSVGVNINQNLEFRASFLGVGMAFDTPDLININIQGKGAAGTSDDDEASQLRRAAIERDVSVVCYVEPINPEHAYRVQPFVWMARAPDGREYLKVAYTAEPGYYPGVSTWWERTYSKPDPTFNLPWWWTTFKRDRTMLTKEMVATPAVPREGDVVEVAVTVRNKALVDARNVKVALWRGSPDNCLDEVCLLDDSALIGIEEVGLIPSQGKREVWFLFRFDGVQNIHATIDDNDELDEMHEDNNHAYSLLFHDMANSGYTLQTLRLDPAIAVSPVVASDGSGLTIGYQVKATVLGDTFTRANVLVQLWHGGVGGAGRLIGTVLVPRVNGSTTTTTRYEVSVFWATRNPALFGKQELHAVILHSGFSTEAANVISHVSRTVSVACYGRVDACGVCGGNNGTCGGCDGVALSGKTVDVCGVCGGTGSTCCIPKPAQAQWHYVRIDHHHHDQLHNNHDNLNGSGNSTNGSSTAAASDSSSSSSWSSIVTRARVGDLVVWENLLDWKVDIVSGAYDYKHAAVFELSRMTTQQGHALEQQLGNLPDDDGALNAFLKEYVSTMWIKDLVEQSTPPGGSPAVAPPAPDSTSAYLRRSTAGDSDDRPQQNQESADLFPGWRTTRPSGSASFEVRKRSQQAEEGADEEFAMGGVCCAQEAIGYDTTMTTMVDEEPAPASFEHLLHDVTHSANLAGMRWSSASDRSRLRASVVAKLIAHKQRLDHVAGLVNSTGGMPLLPEENQMRQVAAARYEEEAISSPDVRCLCRRTSSSSSSSRSSEQCSAEDAFFQRCVNPLTPDSGVVFPGLFNFAPIVTRPDGPSAVLPPGAASAPHRFFSPGLYLWHDSHNPAIHGVVLVAPSELVADECGVCGGDGTSCRDCQGTPFGTARVDACGVCVDPMAPGYAPNPAIDCAGVCYGAAMLDACGECAGGTTGRAPGASMDCLGVCHGSAVVDCLHICGGPYQVDCAGVCDGGAVLIDGVCSSSGKRGLEEEEEEEKAGGCEDGAVADCMGVCNGSARFNPCGVCVVAAADYHKGEDYWVDCADTCRGTAYIGDCGVCVGGRSGLWPNEHKDCQGTCFGNATRDECGVCFVEGDGHHVVNSGKDCAGVCGGKAVVDECGECVLGTTGREFNSAKDCAGQCFGGRLPTDPACVCEREELDKCFVCGGDNSACAGCDGVPNSGAVHDLCGVCGGDNSTCCFLPFAQTTVLIRDFDTVVLPNALDAGETLLVTNQHLNYRYTFRLVKLTSDSKAKAVARYPKLLPGNSLRVGATEPGEYLLQSAKRSAVSIQFSVRFNRKARDSCGRCVYADAETGNSNRAAYDRCCEVMESKDDVHAWFETTHFHDSAADPAAVTRVAPRTGAYRSAPARHLLRLVESQAVDARTWRAADQRLAVGDVVVLENRDLFDHVISITGPQPMPDVVLDRGMVALVGPVLTPGTYRVESRSNLINTTFTVEFDFACTVHVTHAKEVQPQGGYRTAVLGVTLVGIFALAALVAGAMVVLYLTAQR